MPVPAVPFLKSEGGIGCELCVMCQGHRGPGAWRCGKVVLTLTWGQCRGPGAIHGALVWNLRKLAESGVGWHQMGSTVRHGEVQREGWSQRGCFTVHLFTTKGLRTHSSPSIILLRPHLNNRERTPQGWHSLF